MSSDKEESQIHQQYKLQHSPHLHDSSTKVPNETQNLTVD